MAKLKFRPTEEQEQIFQASREGYTMVVNSVAGSGKTSSVEADATLNPRHSLYLVYNAANRKEAQNRMPRHVKPMTGHSLAFRPMIANNDDLRRKFEAARNGSRITPWDIASAINVRGAHGMDATQMSGHILRTVSGFQNSADREIHSRHVDPSSLPARFLLPEKQRELTSLKHHLVTEAHKLWVKMTDPKDDFGLLHDTYLKMYSLENPKLNYDLIYCDEFQDTNPVLADIVRQQDHAQKIYIGDRYQAIYGWRGAKDALGEALKDGAELLHLSRSFRFGKHVAGMANIILEHLGANSNVIGAGPQMRAFDKSQATAIIGRNNMTLFEHAVEAIEAKVPFTIVGGSRDMVNLIESGYALYIGDNYGIKDTDLKRYDSWDEFKEISDIMQDAVSKRLISFIERYKAKSLTYIDDLLKSDKVPEDAAQRVLTSAHKSKGREFNQTLLCEDLALDEKLTDISSLNPAELTTAQQEQFHLLYVAITRCQEAMQFAPEVKKTMRVMLEANRSNREDQAQATFSDQVQGAVATPGV